MLIWLVVWSTMAFGQNYSILTTHVAVKTESEISKRVVAGIKWEFRLDSEKHNGVISALTHDGNEFSFTIYDWENKDGSLWLYAVEDSTGDDTSIMLTKNDRKHMVLMSVVGSRVIVIYDDI